MVVFPHKFPHIAVQLFSRLIIRFQWCLNTISSFKHILYVDLLSGMVLHNSQMIQGDLSHEPLFHIDLLAELQCPTFEELGAVEVGKDFGEHVVRNNSGCL